MSEESLGRVMILGSGGMVGSAVIRLLEKTESVSEVIPVFREQVDLANQADTFAFIASKKPDWVVVAAAKVGGIHANNTYPADFIYQNLAIELNAIEGAYRAGVEKIVFLGSSCIYPKFADQPIREESLLAGELELTNEPYALAKIAGIKLCESYNRQHGTDYRALMPTNLYGPGDNYHPVNSHVIPALIRRFHQAKLNNESKIEVWGSGKARREFLYVDDLAEAILHVMKLDKTKYSRVVSERCSHLNVGTGIETSIAGLADSLRKMICPELKVEYDSSKPEGPPRKVTNIQKISQLGWAAKYKLDEGLAIAYQDYISFHEGYPNQL